MEKERFQRDITQQIQKIDRANQQLNVAYNNAKQVKGNDFEGSLENVITQAVVEEEKTKHLLNALSVIVNEFPALGTVIRSSFGDELHIPSRPQSAIERPVSGGSHPSGNR